MQPTIYFVAGMPRSGSTLLMNLLGQNPNHHVTPTSGLNGLISVVKNQWMNIEPFKAQGLSNIEPRVSSSIRGMMYGFYEKELGAGKIVFDKNRVWPQQIELLEDALNRRIKVICTVRDTKAVVASFEKLYRKSPLSRKIPMGAANLDAQTINGRANLLLGNGGVIGSAINMIRDAYVRGFEDRLIIIPYQDLVSKPLVVVNEIHASLNIPKFKYDPDNVTQITKEDDILYGWGNDLHTIRPKIETPKENPWINILPRDLCERINIEFADINNLSKPKF